MATTLRISRLFSTIRARITGLFTILFLACMLLVYVIISSMVGQFLVDQRIVAQSQQVESFAATMGRTVFDRDAGAMYDAAVSQGKKMSGRVLILDTAGTVLADGFSELNGRVLQYQEVQQVVSGQATASYGFHRISPKEESFFASSTWAVYYTAQVVNESTPVGVVLVSVSIQDVRDSLMTSMLKIGLAGVAVVTLLILCCVMISRWISRPIVSMTDILEKMSRGRFDLRVQVPSSREIANMATTINMMSQKLEDLDKTRSDFVANASHELKTPLSSIKILAESLLYQDHVPEETYKEFLGDINQQIDRMVALLNDLLVISQTEQPEYQLNRTSVDLDGLIGRVITVLTPFAEESDIQLTGEKSGVTAYCDANLMQTAVENLVNNGIKYTPQGGLVTVSARAGSDGVEIVVRDTGIGIPEKDQIHIFDRFYRVDKARARQTGGTGLGLSIVDTIVKLHEGKVTVESQEGKGSTFIIWIPGRREGL